MNNLSSFSFYFYVFKYVLFKDNIYVCVFHTHTLPEYYEGDAASFHEVKRTNEQEEAQGLGLIFSAVSRRGTLSTTQAQELTHAEMCTLGKAQLLGVVMTSGLGTRAPSVLLSYGPCKRSSISFTHRQAHHYSSAVPDGSQPQPAVAVVIPNPVGSSRST